MPATRSSIEPEAPVDVQDQVVDVRRDGLLGHRRGVAGLDQRAEPAVGDPVGARQRSAVVEDRLLVARRRRRHERRAPEAGVDRVGEQVDALAGDLLADPGAAAALAVDRLPLVGGPGAGVPVGVDHQVGHRRGRQDRVVATRGQVDLAGAPAEPLLQRRVQREGVHLGEVAGGAADPGAAPAVGGLAGAAVVTGRLDVPQAQAGGGAEVGGGDAVVDEPVEHPAAGLGPAERLPERRGERVVDVDVGLPGGVVPVGGGGARDEVGDVLGRGAGPRRGVGGLDERGDLRRSRWRCR